ncbi:membrane protein [Flavobacterium sp. GSB-24]|nr:membrane protein [Flavobacterium sp. GSB-24]
MYNTININPAYAGSRGVLSLFGLHRSQWIGMDGAPESNAVSINTPINESNIGLGVSLISDKIGPTSDTKISADLSYTIQTSDSWKLSFGVKATASIFNLDVAKLNPQISGDPQFQNSISEFSPNIGTGIYWHSNKGYIGLSVPGFIQTQHYNDNDLAIYKEQINYYLIGGCILNLSQEVKFKPAFLVKLVEGAPLQADISANFLFFEKLTIGAAYRWDAAVSAIAGFQISNGLYLGYGYDSETTKLRKYNSGSHEIFLRFEFFKKYDRITTGRFF